MQADRGQGEPIGSFASCEAGQYMPFARRKPCREPVFKSLIFDEFRRTMVCVAFL